MKKNLISVIILALCLVNLVLNCLIVFVCMPSAQKTNNLITDIASVLKLELTGSDTVQIPLEQIATMESADTIMANLPDDAAGGKHYAMLKYIISMDNKADDYAKLSSLLGSSMGLVDDTVRSTISQYSYEQLNSAEGQTKVKKEILRKLQQQFNTETIYGVDFKEFTLQ